MKAHAVLIAAVIFGSTSPLFGQGVIGRMARPRRDTVAIAPVPVVVIDSVWVTTGRPRAGMNTAATNSGAASGAPAHAAAGQHVNGQHAAEQAMAGKPMSETTMEEGGVFIPGSVVSAQRVATMDWAVVNAQVAREMLATGYIPVEPPYRSMLPNRSDQLLRVQARTPRALRLQGTCDRWCRDLDLELLDDAGRVILADNGANNTPVIEVPQGHARMLYVRVVMNHCSALSCRYQLMSFLRN